MFKYQSGKALFPFIIATLLVLCGYLYFPHGQGQQGRNGPRAVEVVAQPLAKGQQRVSIEALGNARANQAIFIKSAQSDYVTSIHFNDGERVSKDQVLVTLKDDEEKLLVRELSVNLKEEKRQLDRLSELSRSQSTAKSLLEEQVARYEATEARLESAKSKLNELTIRAPFAGILGKRLISPGAFITNNTEITTLDDISVLKVDFKVPEKYFAALQIGMAVDAGSDAYPEHVFHGKVTHLGSRIDPATRSVPITASFTNPDLQLRPGMLLTTTLVLNSFEALSVPEKAIIPMQGKHFVYRVTNNIAERVEVTVIGRHLGQVALQGELNEGDLIVTEGVMKLRPGSQVKLKGQAL